MDEYVIKKIDGKYVCTSRDSQSVEYLVTKLPGSFVQLDKDFAWIRYRGFRLAVSRTAYGGFFEGAWSATGTVSIELVDWPRQVCVRSLVLLEWDMHGEGQTNEWGWKAYGFDLRERRSVVLGSGDKHSTFDDLMRATVQVYPDLEMEIPWLDE